MILHDDFYYEVRHHLLNKIKPLNQLAEELSVSVDDITDFIAVASNAQNNGDRIFEARYHMFIRGIEGVYVTLNPSNKLFIRKMETYKEDPKSNDCGFKVFEITFCYNCNATFEANGDMEKAIEILRERGLAAAAKKAGRIAAEGVVDAYIHGDGRIGVLVEINTETDFAAKNEDFRTFVKDIAMHIAASKPEYISRDEVPAERVEKEKEILRAQALNEGKPEKIVEKMVEGRLEKFFLIKGNMPFGTAVYKRS